MATPLWGKLGDLFGHKYTFMASIVLFLLGSALCGMSEDMLQLIGFRAFQGLGAGGLMVGIMSVIGMLVSPRDRGKYQGVMMAVMPAAMIGGPLVGGYITDNMSWRWVFYVNLPLGLLSLAVVWFTLNLTHEKRHRDDVVIDWWGAGLLSVWITSLVLAITWGGTQYAWGSWQILGLGAVAAVGLVAFVRVERDAREPIMPLRLFGSMNFTLTAVLGFVAGFAMFGGMTFLPQYQQFVQGQSATNSGLLLTPMMISAMVLSLGGGLVISRTGHYKAFPIAGTALLVVGLWLFSRMDLDTTTTQTAIAMVVMGAGMGCLMQTTNLIAQNSIAITDIGAGTGAVTFLRNMGGSLGVAALGAIYTNQLTSTLAQAGVGSSGAGAGAATAGGMIPEVLRSMPAAVRHLFQQAVVNGTSAIFFWGAVVGVVGFVLAWGITQVPLRATVVPQPSRPLERVEETAAV